MIVGEAKLVSTSIDLIKALLHNSSGATHNRTYSREYLNLIRPRTARKQGDVAKSASKKDIENSAKNSGAHRPLTGLRRAENNSSTTGDGNSSTSSNSSSVGRMRSRGSMLGAAAAKLKKKMQSQNWKHLEAGRTALLQPLTVISKPLVLRPVRPNENFHGEEYGHACMLA